MRISRVFDGPGRFAGAIAIVALAGCQRRGDDGLPFELASAKGVILDPSTVRPPADYDPLALASASIGRVHNQEANIPSLCYTRTDGISNPCWTCHLRSSYPNLTDDWELQQNYSFSDYAKVNHWRNLFRDRTQLVARFTDDDVLAYVRGNNYDPLRAALARRPEFPGWRPDLDLARGFDEAGFANDGSGWRAIRYKPFLGTFWPTNGSADDVFVRLADEFQRDAAGTRSRAIYQANLAILEAAIASDPRSSDVELVRVIEPIDERAAGLDLDRDGKLDVATTIVGLPATYVGAAAQVRVFRALYPAGTEFLHTVRYLDPDQPSFFARRMKEVRYARKTGFLERKEIVAAYANAETRDAPPYTGDPRTGLRNAFGWQLQGWIEDPRGWLRLQTHEEHVFCMGCHTGVGVTVDQTYAFGRKLPGRDGWRPQDPRGIADAPQAGQTEPEYAQYLARVGGGDELRANAEIRARFFAAGTLDRDRVAALRDDIGELVFPTRARAIALDRAYLANVIEQSYVWGRDAISSPATNVHTRIIERSTGLGEQDRVYRDGRLQLDWSSIPGR